MADYNQNHFSVDPALANRLASIKESIWLRIGTMQSSMNDRERALEAFERVLTVNPSNVRAMTQAGAVLAKKECYPQAVAYLQKAISADSSCGEAWAVLAHCYVMTDDLQKAYQAYQSALCHLPNPRDPNLWYGIGLLYDRYGSLDNALEAFLAVLSISPNFERADEVCFCIGIIFKEQQNFDEALKYFNKVVVAANPPPPLTRADGWYQIGHVNELKRDIPAALQMYKHALAENPKHPKTLQNFGWLEHQHNNNSPEAIRLLKMSTELDASDGQTWYLLGRVYMALREFRQAYDAYQQAVYRDGRNATFWCSIGVLYYQMNQYRDAMDAYSRAIRLNPYVSEVWYDLGTLYESCAQNSDAIDAYRRAAELAPDNTQITQRLQVLETSVNTAHPQQSAQHSSVPQATQQMPPVQMQPDLRHSNQPHHQGINPVLGRPMPSAMQQQQQPHSLGQKLPPHAGLPPTQLPATQQPGHPSVIPPPSAVHATSSLPQRSAHMEMSPIPSIHSQAVNHTQQPTRAGPFSQDTRLPAPPTAAPLSLPQGSNHVSQTLHPQQTTSTLPSQGIGAVPPPQQQQQDSMNSTHQRSMALSSSRLQPLNPMSTGQDHANNRSNSHLGHGSTLQPIHHHHQQQSNHLPQLSTTQPPVPSAAQSTHNPSEQRLQINTNTQTQSHAPVHPASHGVQAAPPLITRSQSQNIPTLNQVPDTARVNQHHVGGALPRIHALPQLKSLPNLPQRDGNHQERLSGPPMSNAASGDQHRQDLHTQSSQYNATGRKIFNHSAEPTKPTSVRPEGEDRAPSYGATPNDTLPGSRPSYNVNQNAGVIPPRNGNPPIREQVTDSNNPHGPTRSMSSRDITQTDARNGQRRMEDDNRMSNDRGRMDMHQQSVHQEREKLPVPDRLQNLSTMQSRQQLNDANRPPASSPNVGGGNNANVRPSLPPLSRNATIGGVTHDEKEGSSIAVGASSLTKFGKAAVRTPVTPSNNTVTPASLPSPLPTRKNSGNGNVLHGARSPRINKSAPIPSFKSVMNPQSVPVQMESVPSPSSLPVLPELSSHSNSIADKTSPREKGAESVNRRASNVPLSSMKSEDKIGNGKLQVSKEDDALLNKSQVGLLRSAPAPVQKEPDRKENEEGSRGGTSKDPEMSVGVKRESSVQDDLGRTAKRPRLHDMNDGKSYSYDGEGKDGKMTIDNTSDGKANDVAKGGGLTTTPKTDIPSFKEIKADLRASSNSQLGDSDNLRKRDNSGRQNETDRGKPHPMGGQVIDLPRLSTPLSKVGGPPQLSGNTPLPSFQRERMNLAASRGGAGSTAVKTSSTDASTPRSTHPFALRSAPVPPLANLNSHASTSRGLAGNGSGKVSQGVTENGSRRSSENKSDGVPTPGSREHVTSDRMANGDVQKGKTALINPEARSASEVNGKEDKQSSRAEIHTTAT